MLKSARNEFGISQHGLDLYYCNFLKNITTWVSTAINTLEALDDTLIQIYRADAPITGFADT